MSDLNNLLNSVKPLLIIGNGFDLQLGLKTSYNDFYKFMELSLDKISNDEWIKNVISKLNLCEDKTIYEKRGAFRLRQFIIDRKNNFFISYLTKYKEKIDTWFLFENELTLILSSIDEIFDYENGSNIDFIPNSSFDGTSIAIKTLEPNTKYTHLESFGSIDTFIFVWSDPYEQNVMHSDLKSFVFQSDGSYVSNVVNYIDDFTKNIESYRKMREDIPKALFYDLRQFADLFAFYLAVVVSNAAFLNPSISFAPRFCINYNYTHILFRNNVSHINGFVNLNLYNDSVTYLPKSNIVFGVSKNNFKNESLNIFSKINQRAMLQTDYGKLLENAICNYNIVVIGHSLRECDHETLKIILKNCNSPMFHLFICYKNNYDISNLMNELSILLEDEFSNLFYSNQITFIPVDEILTKS